MARTRIDEGDKMPGYNLLKSLFWGSACAVSIATGAFAEKFNIPAGNLDDALSAYSTQTGVQLIVSDDAVRGVQTRGVAGNLSADDALSHILSGTGFVVRRQSGAIVLMRSAPQAAEERPPMEIAQATAAPHGAVETVTVTSSKLGGADVQSIPISITALSQEQLTATQTAGGPDLIKQVPNMTFTKTNFSGYSIQLRGIGTQAISVTTDPAVAVAFNDIPFIRNHFFEQEFYDVSQVEVLRGPQGTLYGRNATAGVVNLVSAKPSDQFEAMVSLEVGNYGERRPEGMINIPIVDDRLDIRIAGEWTKRQGYSFNELTGSRIDGRDLWSGRVSIGLKLASNVQSNLVWEHFSEDDDRMRTSKQLCKTDPSPTEVEGITVPNGNTSVTDPHFFMSQGCSPTSLYSADAFEVPNGLTLGYYTGVGALHAPTHQEFDIYASTTQSQNLRVIETTLDPVYRAKNDTVELNTDYNVTPALTFTSQTGFNHDFLWSTEDYNRFDTARGAFTYYVPQSGQRNEFGQLLPPTDGFVACGEGGGDCAPAGIFCDPQLGCSDRLVAEDLSDEHAWQLSQEFRLVSNFSGPLNFSVGGNYLHYETEENYYVFINSLTLAAAGEGPPSGVASSQWVPGVSDNSQCIPGGFVDSNPLAVHDVQAYQCIYIDPNPITKVNGEGHNYFLSQNPYVLNSYAGFGEAYYNVLPDLKLITGLRWTEDQKHFTDIPSELFVAGYGYASTGVVNQQWDQFTGRAAVNWTPKLDFTDQTLMYASYSHGYKAGGANPPGAILLTGGGDNAEIGDPIHPLTFKPEFVDAFELGSKNTLLDDSLTINGDVFYYNYENYQISEIVDRTSINLNFDTHVKGAELESTWEPIPGLRFNFAGGWEDTALAKGSQSVDLMDRTAGHAGWMVIKPFFTQSSNCVLPTYVVVDAMLDLGELSVACGDAYNAHQHIYGFDPVSPTATNNGAGPAPNNGEGFDKNLSGNKLPNAPPFTVSWGAQYALPLTTDWAGTLRGDYYWQDYSWARVFNDNPYDRLRGYTNVNLTLIFTNQNGWQVMLYDKNVFDTTAITGTFLNSDDSGLTTNVFLTDPKLIGIRVTKNW